jgi:ribulose-phosphate 3-epimerase
MRPGPVRIEASILSADYANLGEAVSQAQAAGVDGIQIDIMDGSFVPDITFGPGLVRALRPLTDLPLDVHLMIVEPERHLAAFAQAGADRILVHQEACPHLHRVLGVIRSLGLQAGAVLNPGTPLAAVEEVLDLAQAVQVMTVDPGWGGQEFLTGQLDKIARLRAHLDELGLEIPILVDGGIDPKTARLAVKAGASVLVSGSDLYNDSASLADNLKRLRAAVHQT